MDPKVYFTVFVVSLFAACGFSDNRFSGIPVIFPTDVLKQLKLLSPPEENQRDQYDSSSRSNSVRTSDSSHFRSLYSPLPSYHFNDQTGNTINSAHKTVNFAQREPPPCAKESVLDGLCEDDSQYDSEVEERFEKALQNSNVSEGFYQSILSKIMVETSVSFESRSGNKRILEDPVCPSREKFIFPRRGMTRSNEWVFLLNQGNLKQGIRVEECLNTSGLSRLRSNGDLSCGLTTDTGIDSVCRQKFIFKNMIAMDRSGTSIVTEAILIPSCCACLQKHTTNTNRLGSGHMFEFDESGNLITESTPSAAENKFEARNQKATNFVSDDEDFSFGLPPM